MTVQFQWYQDSNPRVWGKLWQYNFNGIKDPTREYEVNSRECNINQRAYKVIRVMI